VIIFGAGTWPARTTWPLTVPHWYSLADGGHPVLVAFQTPEQQSRALVTLNKAVAVGVTKKDLDLVPVFALPGGEPEELSARTAAPDALPAQLAAVKTMREACKPPWRALFLQMTSPLQGTDEDGCHMMMVLVGPGAAYRTLEQVCLGTDEGEAPRAMAFLKGLGSRPALLALLRTEPAVIGPLMCELTWAGAACATCGKRGPTQRCSGCVVTHYCNAECQNTGWTRHKLRCKTLLALRGL